MLLRIRFDDPGWFTNDPRLVITVDGRPVYQGSFRGGMTASIDVPPGPHRIETAIEIIPGIARRQEYTVEVPSDAYRQSAAGVEARLKYSRIRGNFAGSLDLRRIDGEH